MKKGIYKRNLLVPFIKLLCDVCAVELAVLTSYYLRFYSPLTNMVPITKGIAPFGEYLAFSLFLSTVCIILFINFRSYRSRLFGRFTQEIPVILKTSFLSILLAMSAAFLYRDFSYSRIVFLLIFLLLALFLLIERYLFHQIKNHFLSKGFNLWRLILVGSPQQLEQVYKRLRADKNHYFLPVGYVSPKTIDIDIPHISTLEDFPEHLDDALEADGLLCVLDQQDHTKIYDIIKMTEGHNLELFYVPDILDIITSNFRSIEAGGIPLLQLKSFVLSGWQGFLKRTFDIILASIGLILLSPFLLLIALLIKLTSRGSILYSQNRVSLDGHEFNMLKFRSMKVDAEIESGPVWTQESDPRVTPIGKLLRRTSLDELPQLFNVLQGNMSLVGPRPERQFFVDQFQGFVPHYVDRHRVRCGMTGWAQVNGLRGQSSIEERTRYDLYYIENWSLWLDLKIIIMTIMEIVRGENAY